MFGTFSAIIPLQYVGCRRTQLGASVAFIIGFLLVGFTYFVQHKGILYVGFLLSGFTNGISIPAAQQYVWKKYFFLKKTNSANFAYNIGQ